MTGPIDNTNNEAWTPFLLLSKSLVELFLGVGTIRILSTDLSDPKLVMSGIDDVKNVADIIDKVRRDGRRRRGLHIETV